MDLFRGEEEHSGNLKIELYTPKKFVDAARIVLGGHIDLDPFSCAVANETVRATRIYTTHQDGYQMPWNAKTVWCNPPYGDEFNARNVRTILEQRRIYGFDIVAWLPASVGTSWFAPLHNYARCWVLGRVTHGGPGNKNMPGQFDNVAVYMGRHRDRFERLFSQFGHVDR